MGQRLASFREFFGMEGERSEGEAYSQRQRRARRMRSEREITDGEAKIGNANDDDDGESSGADEDANEEAKSNGNAIATEESTPPTLDNRDARFESIYSRPTDVRDTDRDCDNGNVVAPAAVDDVDSKRPEAEFGCSGGSNGGSSSDDAPVDPPLRRTSKTLSFGRQKIKQRGKDQGVACNHVLSTKKKRSNWVLKFNCAKSKGSKNTDIPEQPNNGAECVCTGYRRTEEHPMGAGIVFDDRSAPQSPVLRPQPSSPIFNPSRFNPAEFPIEDCDARARLQRAREMEEGIEPPPGYRPNYSSRIQVHPNGITIDSLAALFQAHAGIHAAALTALSQIDFTLVPNIDRPAHTQVDYVHCLVPDLRSITACSFYWGKMDRYEAERLLEGKPEGTFLLRDSAQEEFLFSVSFRKYERSLHARIEQWNHKFSFDAHDPGVYASETVCGLIEHYKDPSCCMFFEPMLTIPLHRNFAFPLQHLCRAVITTRTTYDGINKLQLPKTLKSYLKEYHYKQRVRVRKLDLENNVMLDSRSISYLPLI